MQEIPYHYDQNGDDILSLTWANPSIDEVYAVEQDYRTGLANPLQEYRTKVVTFDHLPTTIHCLYEAEIYPRQYPDLDSDQFESMQDNEHLFVESVIDAFSGVEDEWEESGQELRWYKEPSIEDIRRVLHRVDFCQPVPDVGGELLSKFITTHPLPNANHRVALSVLELYLQTFDQNFELPDTGITGEWFDWAEEYVFESKVLMTLARKCELLSYLREWGCEAVVRDGDNRIVFDEYDLAVDDSFRYYAGSEHLAQSKVFVKAILDRTNQIDLMEREDDGKEAFLSRLAR